MSVINGDNINIDLTSRRDAANTKVPASDWFLPLSSKDFATRLRPTLSPFRKGLPACAFGKSRVIWSDMAGTQAGESWERSLQRFISDRIFSTHVLFGDQPHRSIYVPGFHGIFNQFSTKLPPEPSIASFIDHKTEHGNG
jgi:hypothetical protein